MSEFNILAEIQKSYTSDEGERRIIEGYASTEILDGHGDIVLRDAFKQSLDSFMANPVLRWQHKEPIGKVLSAQIDDKGLYIIAELAKNVPEADKAWELIKQGVVKSFSIGAKIGENGVEYEEKDGKLVRIIKNLILKEISVVDIPANPMAVMTAIHKALEDFERKEEEIMVEKSCCEEVEKGDYSTSSWNPPMDKEGRKKLLEKCGRSAFLLPDELKFPVKDSSCKYNINGLKAAIRRAAQHGYKDVEERARRILERLTGEKYEVIVVEKSIDSARSILNNVVDDLDWLYSYIKDNVDNPSAKAKARKVLNAVMSALKEMQKEDSGGEIMSEKIQEKQEKVEVEKKFIVRENGQIKHVSEIEEKPSEEPKSEDSKKKGKKVKKEEEVNEVQKSEEVVKEEITVEKIQEIIEKVLEEKIDMLKKSYTSEVSETVEKSSEDLEKKRAGELLAKALGIDIKE